VEDSQKANSVRIENFNAVVSKFVGNTSINAGASWSQAGRVKTIISCTVAYPGILFGEGPTNSVEDRGQRERGSEGGSPLVRGSGGSCNLVQEISFNIVKCS